MNMIFKALSDPTRRQILQLLRKRPMSAGELAEQFDITKPTMSGHFTVLRDADLIYSRKQGTSVIYRINLSVLEDALLAFAHMVGVGLPAKNKLPGKLGRAVRGSDE